MFLRAINYGGRSTLELQKRTFLTAYEKEENDKLDEMAENIGAQREIFISKDQQVAMAMEGDDEASIESKLTKGDAAPPSAAKKQ